MNIFARLDVRVVDNNVIITISAALLMVEAEGVHKLMNNCSGLSVAVTARIKRHSLSSTNATDVTRASSPIIKKKYHYQCAMLYNKFITVRTLRQSSEWTRNQFPY